MARQLNDNVRKAIALTLRVRGISQAEAARRLDRGPGAETWLGRRLNGTTPLDLTDVELICSRLDIPISDVLHTEATS